MNIKFFVLLILFLAFSSSYVFAADDYMAVCSYEESTNNVTSLNSFLALLDVDEKGGLSLEVVDKNIVDAIDGSKTLVQIAAAHPICDRTRQCGPEGDPRAANRLRCTNCRNNTCYVCTRCECGELKGGQDITGSSIDNACEACCRFYVDHDSNVAGAMKQRVTEQCIANQCSK